MANFPTVLDNVQDGVTEIMAMHINNLQSKVGIDGSAVTTSLDYLLKNSASVDPGHYHSGATIQAGAIALSNMANLAASSIIGNNTGSPATPLALSASQVKSLLAIAQADVSGLTTASSPTFAGLSVPYLRPLSDSTEAIKFQNTVGTIAVLVLDTINSRVGLGVAPNHTLDINGGFFSVLPGGQSILLDDSNGNIAMIGTNYYMDILSNGTLNYRNHNYVILMSLSESTGNLTMEASGGGYYNASTHAWVNGSSIRWKDNVTPIANALALVKNLIGIKFNWKNNGVSGIGLIAEDVFKVIPEAVDVDLEDPRFCSGVNYGALVALLVEAIKEQQAQIAALQARLN